jgi:hypothetical protein
MKMRLRLKRKKEIKEGGLRDKVAGKIAAGILRLQTQFSDRMNKIFSTMNTKHIKLWLIIFSFSSGGLSIYFFVSALTEKKPVPVQVDRIHMLLHLNEDAADEMNNRVDASVYDRIQEYKRYMDSTGEAIRPSLADSIKMLEEIYLSQQK